jgi:hypothetical protein
MATPVAAQGGNTTARLALVDARRSLEAGSFREAESKYTAALRQLSRSENQLRAAALFGRAFAAQQRLVSGDTADLRSSPTVC